jgi:hypothetical protein
MSKEKRGLDYSRGIGVHKEKRGKISLVFQFNLFLFFCVLIIFREDWKYGLSYSD